MNGRPKINAKNVAVVCLVGLFIIAMFLFAFFVVGLTLGWWH